MDELLTDEQQAEKARNWIRENGVFIAAGIVLGLGILFGWQQWREHQVVVAGEASIVWEQMRSAIDGERFNEASEALEILATEYADTPYLDQGRLAIARMQMERNSPDLALEQLEMVARDAKDPQVRRVAELRTAQVLSYQGDYEAALAALGPEDTSAFASLYHDMRGDVFTALQRFDEAANEYRLALDLDTANAIDRSYVQVKLDDVSGSLAAVAEAGSEIATESAPVGAE